MWVTRAKITPIIAWKHAGQTNYIHFWHWQVRTSQLGLGICLNIMLCQNYVRFRLSNSILPLRRAMLLTRVIYGTNRQLHYVKNGVSMCCVISCCDSPDPRTGPRTPIFWKRGFGKKAHFPPLPSHGLEKGVFSQKNPHFRCVPLQKKRGFFGQKTPFSRTRRNGSFWTPKPSFPEKWGLGACLGPGES